MSYYFATVSPTYIENWSDALRMLTIPHRDITLTLDEASALGWMNHEYRDWFGNSNIGLVDGIVKRIDIAMSDYPDGAFVRLGSRSGKDSSYANNRGLRVRDGIAAVKMLTENTHRIAQDLRLALNNNYCPHVFVRQWMNIPAWSEFRCFMRGRRLVGISQYDHRSLGHCQDIKKNAENIRVAIEDFFAPIRDASHLDDMVFDVFVTVNEYDSRRPVEVQLLEVNPFFRRTDACLFHWRNGGDFDGTFRFVQAREKGKS